MLPVWGAYILSCVCLGLWLFTKYVEPETARLRYQAAVKEEHAAELAKETARLRLAAESFRRSTAEAQERIMDRMGWPVAPPPKKDPE